jgi:tetratricopeptide (TPR) repeat protein
MYWRATLVWLKKLRGKSSRPENKALSSEAGQLAFQQGLEFARQNMWPDAEAAFQQAVINHPSASDAHLNLSVSRAQLGNLPGALQSAETAVKLNLSRQTLLNLGSVAMRTNNFKIAADSYKRLIEIDPKDVSSRHSLGIALLSLGEWRDAAKELKKTRQRGTPQINIDLPLAIAYRELGLYGKAQSLITVLLKRERESLSLFLEAAKLTAAKGELENSISALDKAIALHPSDMSVRVTIAKLLIRQDRKENARDMFLSIIQDDPEHTYALSALGNLAHEKADYANATSYLKRALETEPDYIPALNDLGLIHLELHDYESAAERLNVVLALEPNDPRAIYNLSVTYMAQGRLGEGWDLSDNKNSKGRQAALSLLSNEKNWDGQTLTNKILRIRPEQGIGDEVRFSTCYGDAIQDAKQCIIECDPRLEKAFKRTYPSAEILPVTLDDRVNEKFPVYDYDFECFAGSLPRQYRRSLSDFPDPSPRLKTDPDLTQKWANRLADINDQFKIGFCWRSEIIDDYRIRVKHYTHIEDWEPILTLPNTSFVNLYHGDASHELAKAKGLYGVDIKCWDDLDLRKDVDDILALLASLDLVITTQTAVWNMAGAVGQDTLVLLNHINLLGAQRVPWFDTVEAITDSRTRAWEDVVGDITNRVQKRLQLHQTKL